MPIRQITPRAAIKRAIDNRIDRILIAAVETLCYAGEEVVKYARDPNRERYKDQTGNLTSSIGYVVLWDGKVIKQSTFEQIKGKKVTTVLNGSKEGRKFLQQLISENDKGLVLIVVAGMPYAACVEALGYDVLDSAEIQAQEIVKRMIGKLRF